MKSVADILQRAISNASVRPDGRGYTVPRSAEAVPIELDAARR